MTQVGIIINRWPADIHIDMTFVQGYEGLFFPPQHIVNLQRHDPVPLRCPLFVPILAQIGAMV